MMARTTTQPESLDSAASRAKAIDSTLAATAVTPESKHRGSVVRRSLHKTLREAHHPSVHKHKRAKDSDATIRSRGATADRGSSGGGGGGGASSSAGGDDDAQDGTPGLKREKGRFILHGKQPSVVQFGSDWPDERMKLRRELWREHNESPAPSSSASRPSPQQAPLRRFPDGPASPVIREFSHRSDEDDDDEDDSEDSNDDDDASSLASAHSLGFREDAEAAAAFAAIPSADAAALPDVSSDEEDGGGGGTNDLSAPTTPAPDRKRTTVIGPSPATTTTTMARHRLSAHEPQSTGYESAVSHQSGASTSPALDGTRIHYHERFPHSANRDTVLGPSVRVVNSQGSTTTTEGGSESEGRDAAVAVPASSAAASTSPPAGEGTTGGEEEEDEEDGAEHIDDDELRRVSKVAVPVW